MSGHNDKERRDVFTTLVLAGRRGPTDPVAQSVGCSHKALVPVGGTPMLLHVVRSLRDASRVGRIVISVDDPAVLRSLDEIRALADAAEVSFHASGPSPSDSALSFFATLPPGERLFVTTADHALLTTGMVDYFCAAAAGSGADVAVGVVAASLFRRHYPASKRSFIPLRSDSFCGTNLFALCGPRAAAAAAFWSHAGRFRKRPWRLISTFGLRNFLLLALRRLDLEQVIPRASRVVGASVAAVLMPFAECAIDVDSLDDLATASQILARRSLPRVGGNGAQT